MAATSPHHSFPLLQACTAITLRSPRLGGPGRARAWPAWQPSWGTRLPARAKRRREGEQLPALPVRSKGEIRAKNKACVLLAMRLNSCWSSFPVAPSERNSKCNVVDLRETLWLRCRGRQKSPAACVTRGQARRAHGLCWL